VRGAGNLELIVDQPQLRVACRTRNRIQSRSVRGEI
jgi:hypothetical protein